MKRTYSGRCQCGRVRYEVSLELGEVISCNCSRCGKMPMTDHLARSPKIAAGRPKSARRALPFRSGDEVPS